MWWKQCWKLVKLLLQSQFFSSFILETAVFIVGYIIYLYFLSKLASLGSTKITKPPSPQLILYSFIRSSLLFQA